MKHAELLFAQAGSAIRADGTPFRRPQHGQFGDAQMSPETSLTPLKSTFAQDPDMADLVEMFIDELPQRINSLQQFYDQEQFQDLQTLAHQIKGAGGGYGYPSLTEAARTLENAVQEDGAGDLKNVQSALDELIHLCQRAQLASE